MVLVNEIFVGIVTCNRTDFFDKCYQSIKKSKNVDYIMVVNDGDDDLKIENNDFYVKNKKNLGVGKSKNILFKKALSLGCEHIFIIEDDIVIKNPNVFNEYINARNLTGIQHFCFGYHGPANKNGISGGKPCPRYIIDYGKVKIAINTHSVGAFCYYSKEVLKKVGIIDENYTNAFEHVDHSYRIAKAGYTTPYWNWADLANSVDYLEEIECSESSSTIRPRKDWSDNIKSGAEYFRQKHGMLPAWNNCVPDTSEENVKLIMKDIFKKFVRNSP
jgi:GT2 family glycosyltransferase